MTMSGVEQALSQARALQFGPPEEGLSYADRPAAFGLAGRSDGRLALVRVTRPEGAYVDLPGGAIEAGESEEAALVREFGEETGLRVRPGVLLTRSAQRLVTHEGRAANNLAGYFSVEVLAERPALKIEADHALIWEDAEAALRLLRHDAHAWAVLAWLRAGRP
jgi:8-oxo-dGTP diphosphatase